MGMKEIFLVIKCLISNKTSYYVHTCNLLFQAYKFEKPNPYFLSQLYCNYYLNSRPTIKLKVKDDLLHKKRRFFGRGNARWQPRGNLWVKVPNTFGHIIEQYYYVLVSSIPKKPCNKQQREIEGSGVSILPNKILCKYALFLCHYMKKCAFYSITIIHERYAIK